MSVSSARKGSVNPDPDVAFMNAAKQTNILNRQVVALKDDFEGFRSEVRSNMTGMRMQMESSQSQFEGLIRLIKTQSDFLKHTLPPSPFLAPGDYVLFCSSCRGDVSIFIDKQIKKEEKAPNLFAWKIICPACKETVFDQMVSGPPDRETELVQTLIEILVKNRLLKAKSDIKTDE